VDHIRSQNYGFNPSDTIAKSYIILNAFQWSITSYAVGNVINKSDYSLRINIEEYIVEDE